MFKYLISVFFDSVFSILLVLNLVVFIWRIIWDVQDMYLEHGKYLSSFVSILISFLIMLYVRASQVKNQLKMEDQANTLKNNIKVKFFIIVFGVANINQWRGVWYLTLYYTDESELGIYTVGALSIVGLIAMKRFCALLSVPFSLSQDTPQVAYQIHPFSNKSNKYLKLNEYNIKITRWLFMLNFMLEYLADILTIQAWRSLWFLFDRKFFPVPELNSDGSKPSDEIIFNLQFKSSVVSLVFGLCLYFILHSLNEPINSYSSKETAKEFEKIVQADESINEDERENYENPKLALKNRIFLYIIFFIGFVSTVNLWRALWMLQLLFCYPPIFRSKLLSVHVLNVIYFLLSLFILCILHLSSAILSRSSCEDDYFTAKNNFILTNNNFDTFVQKQFLNQKCLKNIKLKEIFDYKRFFGKCSEDSNYNRGKNEKLIHQVNEKNEIVLIFQENSV